MIHIGAKIPPDMASSIEAIAPYVRGGKSEVIRWSLSIGLERIQKLKNFPIGKPKNKPTSCK
jgi:hypothetical protein